MPVRGERSGVEAIDKVCTRTKAMGTEAEMRVAIIISLVELAPLLNRRTLYETSGKP